jgi:Co/Zn/Cd efflux system component
MSQPLSPANKTTRPKTYSFNISNPLAEKKVKWAVILTAIMMVVEITGGYIYNS